MSDIDTAVEAEAPGGGRSRRKLLIVGLVVVLAAAGVGYVVFGGAGEANAAPEEVVPTEGAVVPLEPMTASIGGGATPGYVRLGIALVLATDVLPADVSDRFPLVQDAALSELSHYDPQRLRTPEGIADLRATLSKRARAIYPDGEVLRVVFTELLVQ